MPQSVHGSGGVNQVYRYQLISMSPDGAIELKLLLSLPVVIGEADANGGAVERCGVVSQAQLLGSDGGFAHMMGSLLSHDNGQFTRNEEAQFIVPRSIQYCSGSLIST